MTYLDPQTVRTKLKEKNTKFVSVRFTKKNGEERKLVGLLKPISKIKGTGRSTPSHLIPIWSPRDGWRSFDETKVLEVR